MLVMNPTQAAAVSHALTEARVLSAYVSFLAMSKEKPADVLVRQVDRLKAALDLVQALKAESDQVAD
jgi:hypothetical protein